MLHPAWASGSDWSARRGATAAGHICTSTSSRGSRRAVVPGSVCIRLGSLPEAVSAEAARRRPAAALPAGRREGNARRQPLLGLEEDQPDTSGRSPTARKPPEKKVERHYAPNRAIGEILKITDAAGRMAYDFAVVVVADEKGRVPPTVHVTYDPTIGIRPGDSYAQGPHLRHHRRQDLESSETAAANHTVRQQQWSRTPRTATSWSNIVTPSRKFSRRGPADGPARRHGHRASLRARRSVTLQAGFRGANNDRDQS